MGDNPIKHLQRGVFNYHQMKILTKRFSAVFHQPITLDLSSPVSFNPLPEHIANCVHKIEHEMYVRGNPKTVM